MRFLRVAPLLLPLLLTTAAACGDEASASGGPTATTPPATEPGAPADETPAATNPIAWESCSLETGKADGRAECANVEVPLDWNAPDGKKVTFFVKRVPCGTTVWRQFVANPTAPLDTSCTSEILGHRFEDDWSTLASYMYGRPSLWSPAPKVGSPNGPPPISAVASKSIENALRRARQDTRFAQLGQRLRARAQS